MSIIDRIPRGWLFLGAAVLSWAVAIGVIIGTAAALSAAVHALSMLFGGGA